MEIETMENWKQIAGYEGLYEISDAGRVLSLKRKAPKFLSAGKSRGYLIVGLSKNGGIMWIIPNSLNEHIDEEVFAKACETSLMWRGKPSKAKTWKTRLKRNEWLKEIMNHATY